VILKLWHTEPLQVETSWNVMAQAQKPDFVFRRNGRRSNAAYTMFRGSVKGTGYPFHSPVSPSLILPSVTVCHHIATGPYKLAAVYVYMYICINRNSSQKLKIIYKCGGLLYFFLGLKLFFTKFCGEGWVHIGHITLDNKI